MLRKEEDEMGFLTHVDDIERKKKLMDDLELGINDIVTIVASCSIEDETVKEIDKDKRRMQSSKYADDFEIVEIITKNSDGNKNISLSFIKKSILKNSR